MEIKCSYRKLLPIEDLVPHPRNPNRHSEKQIALLAKILKSSGFRSPIVISKRSGFIVKGHGRLESAKLAGFHQVPVDEQEYETEAEEYSDMIADNRIAELSELDNTTLKDLIEELDDGTNDLELTGYSDEDLEKLMSQIQPETTDLSDSVEGFYKIEVTCKDESEQEKIFSELQERNIECKLLTL